MSTDRRRHADWPPLRRLTRTRLPDSLSDALDARMAADGVTEAEVGRRALAFYLEKTNAGEIASPALNTPPAQAESAPQA